MKSATIVSPERTKAEPGPHAAPAPQSAPRATVTSGRIHAPLTGRVHGTGVPFARSNSNDSASAVLCNITEQTWILHRTHGTFVVAGRTAADPAEQGIDAPEIEDAAVVPPGSRPAQLPLPQAKNAGQEPLRLSSGPAGGTLPPYALTTIAARTGSIDLGDKRTLEFPISARDIAEDLAREINADGGEASYFGVFVCEGAEPTPEELDEARERLDLFYRTLVSSADKQWERTHNVVFISDLERRAARELKFEKEWSYEPQQRIDCPACGEKLKPNVAVCKVCGAVLDRAKAAQFGLVSPSEVSNVPKQAPISK